MNSSNNVVLEGKCNSSFITATCNLKISPTRSVQSTKLFAMLSIKPILVLPTGSVAKCTSKCGSCFLRKWDSSPPGSGNHLNNGKVENKPKGQQQMTQPWKSASCDLHIHFYVQAFICPGAYAHLQTYLINWKQRSDFLSFLFFFWKKRNRKWINYMCVTCVWLPEGRLSFRQASLFDNSFCPIAARCDRCDQLPSRGQRIAWGSTQAPWQRGPCGRHPLPPRNQPAAIPRGEITVSSPVSGT